MVRKSGKITNIIGENRKFHIVILNTASAPGTCHFLVNTADMFLHWCLYHMTSIMTFCKKNKKKQKQFLTSVNL